eukprot:scaffold231308_cov35-Prasinocladus_malaysianus.AAC.1
MYLYWATHLRHQHDTATPPLAALASDTTTEQTPTAPRVCYRCSRKDHIAARCPMLAASAKAPIDTTARGTAPSQTAKRTKTDDRPRLPHSISQVLPLRGHPRSRWPYQPYSSTMMAASSRAQPLYQRRAYDILADPPTAVIYPHCVWRHFRDTAHTYHARRPQPYRTPL